MCSACLPSGVYISCCLYSARDSRYLLVSYISSLLSSPHRTLNDDKSAFVRNDVDGTHKGLRSGGRVEQRMRQ